MVLEKLDTATSKGMKLDYYLISYIKINSKKWIKDLYLRTKTKKLLEEGTGENLYNPGFGKYLTKI